MTKLEGDYPFVECATFADEIKAKGGSFQSPWHFVDIPFLDEGGSLDDYPQFKLDDHNITVIVPGIVDWLTESGNYKSNYVYQTLKSHFSDEQQARSYALRLLIHYIGDIHQPLHATSRVDSKYPKGDAGGNFFTLPTKDGAKNLHSVWDSMVYEHPETPSLPYSSSDWNSLGNTVSSMVAKNIFSPSDYENVDINSWANESFELAKSSVYSDITEKKALPQSYIDENQKAIDKQIVIGGLRLAYVIKTIFGNQAHSTMGMNELFLQ
jgi:hypothetical protein